VYPAAVVVRRFTTSLAACESCSPYRYTESIEYHLPPSSSLSAVAAFYKSHVPAGWHLATMNHDCAEPSPGTTGPIPMSPTPDFVPLVSPDLKVVGVSAVRLTSGDVSLQFFRAEHALGCVIPPT
jgi:hypothetical protein